MNHWLVKQEPDAYSWDTFAKEGRTDWTGVRNYQARNYLRAMTSGDRVLFYHSVGPREVVGIAEVTREAFPDPTAAKGDWSAVELSAREALPRPVSLDAIKADAALAELPLIRQSRLSVMPIPAKAYARILRMGGVKKPAQR
ncbi:MAG: EVE domain-containing protein [Puniceicoccaceae bacterium]|nr:MAG: EVE domain-containing protein [Puniceicoccaceae bacterium]